jgi:hypothetical protein
MLRKLIMLAITSVLAKKAYERYSGRPDLPFPTSRNHPPQP